MKKVAIEELDSNTSRWLREASRQESIVVTDQGRPVVTVLPAQPVGGQPRGFRTRVLLSAYGAQAGKLGGGRDSSLLISEDRDHPVA